MGKKAALHNLGCKVNAYETEAMQRMLEQAGYQIVPFTECADVYVVNTCSVTNIADRKSRQMLHRAKKRNPDSVVVAVGCYVQTSPEQAREDAAIDLMIGNDHKHELIELLQQYETMRDNDEPLICVKDIRQSDEPYEELHLEKTAEHTRAFLKVQDGCNQFCSYCIIPYARGRVRSNRISQVVKEVTRLAENGYQEIVLTGIHLSSYGIDHGENLLSLIQKVHEVDKIRRIRLGSLEPNIMTEEFCTGLLMLPKVCAHFHLSLQSGCDETLKRMNRKYDTASFAQKCALLRNIFEHPAITTDVIVGFPGETQEEFEKTFRFLEQIRFYEMHVFKYSVRKGTKAAAMEHQVSEERKAARSAALLELAETMSKQFREYYIGRQTEALLEEPYFYNGRMYYVGFTREYIKVAVETDANLRNCFVRGTIQAHLTGEMYLMVEF